MCCAWSSVGFISLLRILSFILTLHISEAGEHYHYHDDFEMPPTFIVAVAVSVIVVVGAIVAVIVIVTVLKRRKKAMGTVTSASYQPGPGLYPNQQLQDFDLPPGYSETLPPPYPSQSGFPKYPPPYPTTSGSISQPTVPPMPR
ncbi:hypothetical protein D915_007932 [Fasciola hepatica]|uniref:Uncharacterized protein n=1 Tax=Fasciola hepatica TaxID=6192 RepID=A0A4E0R0R9_FASHE|nr:hypothetical protein D915_007932 [Fasciola hepatica]